MRKVAGTIGVIMQWPLSEEHFWAAEIKAALHNVLDKAVETVIKTVPSEKLGKSKDKKTPNSIKNIDKLPQKNIALKNSSCLRKTFERNHWQITVLFEVLGELDREWFCCPTYSAIRWFRFTLRLFQVLKVERASPSSRLYNGRKL